MISSSCRAVAFATALCFVVSTSALAGSLSVVRADHWVEVARVIDGDTFEASTGEHIRLLGINTPETAHNDKPAQPMGESAFSALRKLIAGQKVRLAFDVEKQDTYGRVLAQVWLPDNTWVNGSLVELGMAHVYTFFPNIRWTQELLKLEQASRSEKLGIWKTSRFKVLAAEHVSDEHIGQFRLVEGRVRSIDQGGWGFYLNNIHVSIPKNVRSRFTVMPALQIAQSLIVRGKLRISRKGNIFMAMYAPEDMEVNP